MFETSSKPNIVFQQLTSIYSTPVKLLILDTVKQHFTAVHICNNIIVWYFDSKNRAPTTLTVALLVAKLQEHYESTYALAPKTTEV